MKNSPKNSSVDSKQNSIGSVAHENHEHKRHEHHIMQDMNPKKMAVSATLHCLIGCMVGEMIGVTIGTHSGFSPHQTVALAASLSFISGYSFSTWPLVRSKISFFKALKLVLLADTLSILAMTIMDNLLMLLIPGAMDKNLLHPIYWVSRSLAVISAFVVAYPVNAYLLKRGKGHAITHEYHH